MFSFRNQDEVLVTWIGKRCDSRLLWFLGQQFDGYLITDFIVHKLPKKRFLIVLVFKRCPPKYMRLDGEYVPMRMTLTGPDYWVMTWLILWARQRTQEEIDEFLPKVQTKMAKV